jgi:hypothetical protein
MIPLFLPEARILPGNKLERRTSERIRCGWGYWDDLRGPTGRDGRPPHEQGATAGRQARQRSIRRSLRPSGARRWSGLSLLVED